MAEGKNEAIWPLPKFHFKVTFGTQGEIEFQEISGLDSEYNVIDYRTGGSKGFLTAKMPRLRTASNIALKKGVFKKNDLFFEWFSGMETNEIVRETVTIQLIDETQTPTLTWTLKNAFPIKISTGAFNADNGEVAIEELVLAHEGLEMKSA